MSPSTVPRSVLVQSGVWPPAVFAGAARAPITAVIIMFELTGEYSIILPLMTAIVIALIFDFINGFHDTANAIATSVATKVLTPHRPSLWPPF